MQEREPGEGRVGLFEGGPESHEVCEERVSRRLFGGVGLLWALCDSENVTLIAVSFSFRIEDVNKHCLEEFRKHWTCLDNNNQQLWQCRPAEWKLNKCVFENLVSPICLAFVFGISC